MTDRPCDTEPPDEAEWIARNSTSRALLKPATPTPEGAIGGGPLPYWKNATVDKALGIKPPIPYRISREFRIAHVSIGKSEDQPDPNATPGETEEQMMDRIERECADD